MHSVFRCVVSFLGKLITAIILIRCLIFLYRRHSQTSKLVEIYSFQKIVRYIKKAVYNVYTTQVITDNLLSNNAIRISEYI